MKKKVYIRSKPWYNKYIKKKKGVLYNDIAIVTDRVTEGQ